VTTPSGLKYEILTPGTGATPTVLDTVTVHYRGTLTNGTEFDSSYSRGRPATFPVNGVIKGWTEALQLMQEGAKWKLTIPPELAYGQRGAGGTIGPNENADFRSRAPEGQLTRDAADSNPVFVIWADRRFG
jgi:FKBP-type peptidyl-prolyl cis-trans isomerase FklB